jgi:hypothetical protein
MFFPNMRQQWLKEHLKPFCLIFFVVLEETKRKEEEEDGVAVAGGRECTRCSETMLLLFSSTLAHHLR